MGFLSNLARQIKDKDDDEAMDIIQRRANLSLVPPPDTTPGPPLPPPARRVVPMIGTPPPPGAPIPAPSRVPVDVGPAPGEPEYDLAQMEDALKNSREMMANADYSNAAIGPDGTMTGVRFPAMAPPVPPPTRRTATVDAVPEPIATGPYTPPPMPRVFVGQSYDPNNPMGRANARLSALRTAAPESSVTDTGSAYEIGPPKRMGRLKAAGLGFLQLMGAGGPTLGGQMGAGTVGAIQGAISPGTVQTRRRAYEIAGAENDIARQQGLETQRLENERRRVMNLTQIADLQNDSLNRQLEEDKELRVEWQQGLNNIGELQKRLDNLDPQSELYASAEKAIQQEAKRLADRTKRSIVVIPGNRKLNQLPRLQVDGQIVQQQHDGTWKAVYGSPKQDNTDENADAKAEYEWQTKNAENEGRRTAAQQEAESLLATAQNHQQKVTAAAGEASKITQQMSSIPPTIPGVGPNPEYEALRNQREHWEQIQRTEQTQMDAAYQKAREKQAEAAKYPTLPAPPKRTKRGQTAASGGQALSKSAWEASHPGGDWNAAMAEANRRKIPIIP